MVFVLRYLRGPQVAYLVESKDTCPVALSGAQLPTFWLGPEWMPMLFSRSESRRVTRPALRNWLAALFKTAIGAALIWVVARHIPAQEPFIRGWVGMLGLILLLHFGSFEVIAFFWQSLGVDATPIMSAPLRSTSLSEFWGSRWNLSFRQLSHDLIFRPILKSWGARIASFLVFLASGLIHDFVISPSSSRRLRASHKLLRAAEPGSDN